MLSRASFNIEKYVWSLINWLYTVIFKRIMIIYHITSHGGHNCLEFNVYSKKAFFMFYQL